jgi:peptidoglycan/xylan/chitin deacetylase (PgdA/CDA1 family)
VGRWRRASEFTTILTVAALLACSPGVGPDQGAPPTPSRTAVSSPTQPDNILTPTPADGSPTDGGDPTAGPTVTHTPPAPAPAPTPTPPAPTPTPTPPATATPTPTATPTSTLPALLRGRIVSTVPTTQKVVALTFDGGASNTGAGAILSTLSSTGVRATFFPTGAFAQRYPATVSAFATAGHRVANHSDTHPDFTTLSTAEQVAQLARAESAIRPLTGRTTTPWFRFPYGASSAAAIATVNSKGYACIGWTVDTLGWKGTSAGQSVETVVTRVLSTVRPGQIVLMHVGANPDDGSTLDADALPKVIAGLKDLGYRLVTIDAALA